MTSPTSLENITLPEGVTELNSTFDHCTNLSKITVPKSVEVPFNTFEGCTDIKITFKGSVYKYEDINDLYSDITD